MILKAIVVDDEPKALEIIALHCKKVPFIELQKSFRGPLEAMAWLQKNTVDLVFLDINMPELSGLKFRQLVGDQLMIIFTTAYTEYAVESYNYDAVDYLLKPVTFERFLKALLKAQRRLPETGEVEAERLIESTTNATDSQIYVKSGTKLYQLRTKDILFLEKDGNYITFHTKERKVLSRQNMGQVLNLLPEQDFVRVHKSYIIALRHIDILENYQLTIAGLRIPIAKTYRAALMERLGMG